MVVLRKGSKPNYAAANAYHPVDLLISLAASVHHH